MRILPLLCLLILPLAVAAPPDFDLQQLKALEQEWQASREAQSAYHIVQERYDHRDGLDEPRRRDTAIRMGDTFYHAWTDRRQPGHLHETVVREEDGQFITFRSGRVISYSFGAVKGQGLGRVALERASGATLLASPPESETWNFIVHTPSTDDHYTVDPSTGTILRLVGRAPGGDSSTTGSILTREYIQLDEAAANEKILAVTASNEAAQQTRNAELEAESARSDLAELLAYLLLLPILAAGSRRALRSLPNRKLRHWLPLTAAIAALIIASYFIMEILMQGWYTMLLAAAADIPMCVLALPEPMYGAALIFTHGVIFGALWLVIVWALVRVTRCRARPGGA